MLHRLSKLAVRYVLPENSVITKAQTNTFNPLHNMEKRIWNFVNGLSKLLVLFSCF